MIQLGIIKLRVGLIALLLWGCGRAEAREFSMPEYLVNPGGIAGLPLNLDDASGLASIDIQINFNPEYLSLETVNTGPLGQQFEMIYTADEGRINCSLVRAEKLLSGSGRLLVLGFRMKEGAPVGLVSPLALASCSLGDESGVVALQRTSAMSLVNGQIEVTDSTNIDNHGNGLPDWWELEYGLDPYADHGGLDPDGDRLTNMQEFLAGTHPLDYSSSLRLYGAPEMSEGVHTLRWQSASNRYYCVEYTTNLLELFEPVADHVPATPGTNEYIVTDPPVADTLFYRIILE